VCNRQKQVKNSQKTVKQQKGPLVYQSSHVCQDCTNSVPIVKNKSKNSQKTVKTAKITVGVPIVTSTQESAEYTKPCGGRSSGWHDIVTCQRLV